MRADVGWRMEDGDGRGQLVPEQMIPVQLDMRGTSERTPELKLVAAVLEEAIRTFCRYSSSRRIRGRRLFREAADWFDSSDATWTFAFENVCQALGLEPDWIRARLRRWVVSQEASADQPPKIASVRRIAGTRHAVTGRAPGLRHLTRVAS